MKISDSVKYIGVNDHVTDLFEGQYKIKNGISYNSYIILDDKIAVMDTVDQNFTHEWLDKVADALNGRKPDYLIIQHMEPDHSANIANFMSVYPETTVVASAKAFLMMKQFFGTDFSDNRKEVGEGDSIDLGHRTLTFVTAPMVHWPEVIVTYDSKDKILFSADGFGKFGALDANEPWEDEARRYYIGIVGKYGKQVQALLKKAASLDIKMICPLHGPVLTENLGHYIGLYDIWSSYSVEKDGIVIAYTSIYGHTAKAVSLLEEKLRVKGCPEVHVFDLARCDISEAVARAFSCGKLVLATTTYNAGIFPHMRNFIEQLPSMTGAKYPACSSARSTWSTSRALSSIPSPSTAWGTFSSARRAARSSCTGTVTRCSPTMSPNSASSRKPPRTKIGFWNTGTRRGRSCTAPIRPCPTGGSLWPPHPRKPCSPGYATSAATSS